MRHRLPWIGLLLYIVTLLLRGWAPATVHAVAPDLLGTWVGDVELAGAPTLLVVRFAPPKGQVDLRLLGHANLPLIAIQQNGDQVGFAVTLPTGEVRFSGRWERDVLVGTAAFAGGEGAFRLYPTVALEADPYDAYVGSFQHPEAGAVLVGRWNRSDHVYYYVQEGRRLSLFPLAEGRFFSEAGELVTFERDAAGRVVGARWQARTAPGPVFGPRHSLYRTEEVRFASGALSLAGTLLLPEGAGPFPAVVFVHGSGRDEREPYRLQADELARRGVAALIYDKRGTGASGGDWRHADFPDLAADALAAVGFLRTQPGIDPERVGLWGISQGGWIVPLAAGQSDDVAFAITVSASGLPPRDQELWRTANLLREVGYAERLVDVSEKGWKLMYDLGRAVRERNVALPPLIWFLHLDAWLDPLPIWRQVSQPVLALYGAVDQLVPPAESAELIQQALADGGNGHVSIHTFAFANHSLLVAQTGAQAELLPERRYAPGYFAAMADWVLALPSHAELGPGVAPEPGQVAPYPLGTYGSAALQLPQMLLFLVVFGGVGLVAPVARLVRRRRADQVRDGFGSVATWLGLVNLALLFGFLWALMQLIVAAPPAYKGMPAIWLVLLVLAPISLLLTAGLVGLGVRRWAGLSRVARLGQALLLVTAVAFVPFLAYWNLLGW